MDFRSTVRLSFAYSMMLSPAFLSAAPEGVITAASGPAFTALTAAVEKRGIAPIQLAQAPASTPASAASEGLKINFLTETQLEKLIKFSDRRPTKATVDEDIAEGLRLSEATDLKTIVFRLGDQQHHFTRLKDDSAFLVGYNTEFEMRIFRIERDARLTAAVAKRGRTPSKAIAFSEAAAEAQAQVAIWSKAANTLKD